MKLKEFIAQRPCRNAVQHSTYNALGAFVVGQMHSEAGKLLATKICSVPLETHLWLLHDANYVPKEDSALPIFFDGELNYLASKSIEELKAVVKTKLVFPRCRVVQ